MQAVSHQMELLLKTMKNNQESLRLMQQQLKAIETKLEPPAPPTHLSPAEENGE
jgi:hypothetical protein